jgi:hypothetical protein
MTTAAKTAKHKESPDIEMPVARLLLAAFDSSESVRFIVQEDGKVLHFNRKAYENSILIHQKELKKGDNLFDYASDTVNNVQTKLRSELKRTFKGESFTTDTEVKYDHRSRWFQTEYIPIFENKKIVAASISTYEITQKKLHEMQLAETIFEVRSSNQHRLQQAELTLDMMAKRIKDIITDIPTSSETDIRKQIRDLCSQLVGLRRKISAWRKRH